MRQANSRRDVQVGEFSPWLCAAIMTADVFVDAATETLIELDTVTFDPHEMFDSTTGTVIIVRDDYYIVNAVATTRLNANQELAVTIRLNGNDVGIRETKVQSSTASSPVTAIATGVLRLVEGDVLSLYVYHDQVGGYTFNLPDVDHINFQVQRAG